MEPDHRFALSLGMLLVILILGTVGYVIIEDVSVVDAAYMTIVTVSTVGYREIIPLSDQGRLFTMFVIMIGVGCVYYATVSLVTMLVGGELRRAREKLKVKKRIEELSGHIIVCGYGRMGRLVAKQLRSQGMDVIIIDIGPERIRIIDEAGYLYLQGDASEEATLIQAGIKRARTLVATLPHDPDNVYVTLTARALHEELLIIARAEVASTDAKLLRAGADRVVCPQTIGANRITGLVTRPNVIDFVDVSDGVEFEIDEFAVAAESPLAGQTLRQAALREKIDAMVVAIKKPNGTNVLNPSAEESIEAGDTLIVIGSLDSMSRLIRL